MLDRTLIVLVALWIVPGAGQAVGVPPKVVRAVPDNADIGVDPGLKEIRITFDQDMNVSGHSICGGGQTFPTIDGEVTWPDARTFVLPVKLVAGKMYVMSVSCPASRNFKSVKGEMAETYPISFATRKTDEAAPAVTEVEAKRAADALRKAIDERYSYRDLRVKDWDKVFAEQGKDMEAARTPSELARAAARVIGAAEDIHATVRIGEFVLPTFRRNVRPNVDFKQVSEEVKEFKKWNGRVFTGMYEGTPYLLIADWTGKKEEYAPALDFIEKNKDAKGMIVDVRLNSGGDELMAREVAGCFVAKRTVYSTNKTRNPGIEGGWTGVMERPIEPTAGRERFGGKVVVLIGKACMSSNESFIRMMKFGAGAILIGERTYGASGNPRPTEIGSGVTVVLPTWVDMTPEGAATEGKGIEPDVKVEWKGGGRDGVLEEGGRLARGA